MSTSDIESRNNGLKLEELLASDPAIKGIARFYHLSVKEDDLATFIRTNDVTQFPTSFFRVTSVTLIFFIPAQ